LLIETLPPSQIRHDVPTFSSVTTHRERPHVHALSIQWTPLDLNYMVIHEYRAERRIWCDAFWIVFNLTTDGDFRFKPDTEQKHICLKSL
jgi:hypothetical protein